MAYTSVLSFLYGKNPRHLKGGFMDIKNCKLLLDRLNMSQPSPLCLSNRHYTIKRIFEHEVENSLSFKSFSKYNF